MDKGGRGVPGPHMGHCRPGGVLERLAAAAWFMTDITCARLPTDWDQL